MISYKQVISYFGIVGILACANQQLEKEINDRSAAQPVRTMHGEVATKGFDAIENSPSLSTEQKQRLLILQKRVMSETFDIQNEISKLKGVLFDSISKSPYDPKIVGALKRRLTILNNQKLDKMFSALNEVEKIVGAIPEAEKKGVYGELLNTSPRGDFY